MHRTDKLSTSMNVTVIHPASNGSNVRRSMFSCLMLLTNVVLDFTSQTLCPRPGRPGRMLGAVSGMGTVQHGHRPVTGSTCKRLQRLRPAVAAVW